MLYTAIFYGARKRKKIVSDGNARKPNKCNTFLLNEISVLDDSRIYHPQKEKVDDGEQENLFGREPI